MSERVLIDKAAGVLTITLNRPEKKNALTVEEYARLGGTIDAANDDPEVRAILIQANGDMFTAGHDLSEFAAINAGGAANRDRPAGEPFLLALANARKPLVAAVHGRAVGIGLTMLLHCDLVYVAEDAFLSSPFVGLALVPEAASSLLLPARIGHVRAFDLFVLGTPIDGRIAVEWGIANAALPAAEVQAKARAAAEALAAKPAAAVRVTKALMRDIPAMIQRIDQEFGHFYAQLRSPEAKEAFCAFFEKRPADFSKL
ncbi:MAG TPA: enoyl-CoA hydratase-related protein [Phenylobacterium sp.]|uniref:enoyl-CoA hydratase-related protein n=1 Tax=Phenylobacterium sp. TaxID=1871053 RepID=UPI002B4643F9|nr:enoyl-CoA hydratase-related protein [Phenylobacterium sp.]HKR90303.1 enoyl-CoA hydratase-related protein [Phenylobacterium sp.]